MFTFKIEKLSRKVTRIFAFSTELIYLVEGDKMAALLDTGSGIGSLKTCVDKLTDKPLIVLLTHGHVDHAMGAGEFKKVYMNHNDDYIYRKHGEFNFRKSCLTMAPPELHISETDFVPTAPIENFRHLKGGDIFDLGGITIEVYDCPGHTRGSLVFLLPEEGAVLLGDACNYFTFMFDEYSTTIAEYEESLKNLLNKIDGKFKTVYLSHGDGNGHKEIIREVIQVCQDIKNGNTDDISFAFMGVQGLVAKVISPEEPRRGNIVYSKHKIYPE
jgi:glyoxylase-like metal-dependent hydrolase (beta-lactamase superfamily II)